MWIGGSRSRREQEEIGCGYTQRGTILFINPIIQGLKPAHLIQQDEALAFLFQPEHLAPLSL